MQVRARRPSGLETEAPHCTLFQLPSGKGQPRAAPHPDLAGRGQRPSSLRRPGPRGGVTAPDPGARPPPGQISSWRGAPPTRTWDPAAISGRCLRPSPSRGSGRRPPDAPRGSDWSSGNPLSRARSRASSPKTPRRGPCRVTEAPRRGAPSLPQRPRDGRRVRTSSREGPSAPSLGGTQLRELTRSRPRRCGPRARPPGSCFLAQRRVSPPAAAAPPPRPPPSSGRCPPRRPWGSARPAPSRSPPPSAPAGALRLPLGAPLPAPAAPPRSPPPAPPPRGWLPSRPPARGPQARTPPVPDARGAPNSRGRPSPSPGSPRSTCRRAGGLGPQWRG